MSAAYRPVEILLDDARPGHDRLRRYSRPVGIVQAIEPCDVGAALEALEGARRSGRHVAGYFSYELGYVLEARLATLLPPNRKVPLLWFGVFDGYEELSGEEALRSRLTGRAYAGPLAHEWDGQDYAQRFARVHDLIDSGDFYQANLSFRSRFAVVGDPMALYMKLRARSCAAHGAYIDDGTRHILSLSPELFFSIHDDREITARPMKGTASRGGNSLENAATRARLQASAKDRAENLMIVDLLRNDLGRVAETGSVAVSDLYEIETYPTLHQMVSTVRARLKPVTTIGEIVHALFPCGSVTGTPKIRAMEIIRELERSPRGVYCGAIGAFGPDGSAEFNVAIRTLTLSEGRGELGIGGAVVHDSTSLAEYNECLLKAQYYETARKPLELIETLRFSPRGGFQRLEPHLKRMEQSASAFGVPFDRDAALREMDAAVVSASVDLRVRLTLNEAAAFGCVAVPLPQTGGSPLTFEIASTPVSSCDVLLRHKTSWREVYEDALASARHCDEVLFVNERGMLTEGTRTNIFVRRGGKLWTPPLAEGLLGGCLRSELLAEGCCEEKVLYPRDLDTAEEVLLGNSLRGLITAVPAQAVGAQCAS